MFGEGIGYPLQYLGFPCGSAGKESACNAGDLGSIPGLGRSPGEGKGYPKTKLPKLNDTKLKNVRTDVFQSCGHCWIFQVCWHIECSTFTVSSFRIWNSSVGIPASPLALFIVMLPKAHLTSHSRMSGSRWVIIPLWLSSNYIWYYLYVESKNMVQMYSI